MKFKKATARVAGVNRAFGGGSLGGTLVKVARNIGWCLIIATILWLSHRAIAAMQLDATSVNSDSHQKAVLHDGQHDFDFEIGKWKAHVRRLGHRLSGSNDWEEFDGTVVTTPFMEGRGNLSEMNVEGATTHTRIQIIAVRLYNPTSRQWSIYGASAKTGVFDPPQIGQFDGSRGEFYASDLFAGRAIYIRYVWQNVSPTTTHFEQAFSGDGGKTWEVNWIYDGTRLTEAASQ
jgi:hypothetical protein